MTDLAQILIITVILAALFIGLVHLTKHNDERFALVHTPNYSRDTIVQRLDRDRPIFQTYMQEV